MDFDIRPVSLATALLWVKGRIHDTDLDSSKQEIVFWNELLSLSAYRAALSKIAELKRAGCPAMIVHACHPAVWHKLDREGCTATFIEKIVWQGTERVARRYVVPPVVFARWVGKWEPSPLAIVPNVVRAFANPIGKPL